LTWEEELESPALVREAAYEASLLQMDLDQPGMLLRRIRHYLAEQTNRGRLKRTYDDVPKLETHSGGIQELICEEVEFRSESKLRFNIQLEQLQEGWRVKRFKFHLHLAGRRIEMIGIHLNQARGRDALNVPRCHLHIGDSQARIPFPIMSPMLMIHLICENLEPDLGV
jgi:hypothetical protein